LGIGFVSLTEAFDMKTLPAAPWAGVGIHLRTNQADPETLRRAAREVLDHPSYRTREGNGSRVRELQCGEESLLRLIESCVRQTVKA
jgi:UDP:flavonoid glycosyltransferase YjiC (YdhE family)